jgi:hypothetical protein
VLYPTVKRGAKRGEERKQAKSDQELDPLVDSGHITTKQVELFKTFRPYMPREYSDEICPMPTYDVLNMAQQERADTRMTKHGGRFSCTSRQG